MKTSDKTTESLKGELLKAITEETQINKIPKLISTINGILFHYKDLIDTSRDPEQKKYFRPISFFTVNFAICLFLAPFIETNSAKSADETGLGYKLFESLIPIFFICLYVLPSAVAFHLLLGKHRTTFRDIVHIRCYSLALFFSSGGIVAIAMIIAGKPESIDSTHPPFIAAIVYLVALLLYFSISILCAIRSVQMDMYAFKLSFLQWLGRAILANIIILPVSFIIVGATLIPGS